MSRLTVCGVWGSSRSSLCFSRLKEDCNRQKVLINEGREGLYLRQTSELYDMGTAGL